jgi:hypothetical protein
VECSHVAKSEGAVLTVSNSVSRSLFFMFLEWHSYALILETLSLQLLSFVRLYSYILSTVSTGDSHLVTRPVQANTQRLLGSKNHITNSPHRRVYAVEDDDDHKEANEKRPIL